jgi:Fructose-bisphosphate aldolase class-I
VQQLARYAATCQAAGLVPIVEPEILIEGGHDIATAAAVSARVISRCVAHLWQQVAPPCTLRLQMLHVYKAVPTGRPLYHVHVAVSGSLSIMQAAVHPVQQRLHSADGAAGWRPAPLGCCIALLAMTSAAQRLLHHVCHQSMAFSWRHSTAGGVVPGGGAAEAADVHPRQRVHRHQGGALGGGRAHPQRHA